MESGIHALSRSETAQAEPNAATITAIAEAPAQRDRFRNLLLNPDDMIVLQSHCPKFGWKRQSSRSPRRRPAISKIRMVASDQQAGCEPDHSLNRDWPRAAVFSGKIAPVNFRLGR